MADRDDFYDDETGEFDWAAYNHERALEAQEDRDQAGDDYRPDESTFPPNTEWDLKTQSRKTIPPTDKRYDPTWGYDEELDPHGKSKNDKWLKSVYEHKKSIGEEGWDLPEKNGKKKKKKTTTSTPSPSASLPQPEYKYYGTDPYQDWDLDLSYLRDAPAFEFEADPWVEPEAFTYPAYERLPAYQKPEDFSYADFIAPSAEEVLAEDPGYQFRLGEGLRAMEAGAAAKGTLRGGGTLKGLMDYGQSAASQEYQRAYDRRLRGYQTGLGAAERAYTTNLGAGERAYGLQVGAHRDAYDRQRRNALEQAQLARHQAYQAYTDQYDRDYRRAQDRYAPALSTWQEEQRAGAQAARDKYQRQWDAYQYAQPSASTIFTSGL
jgi:hypothetical protein